MWSVDTLGDPDLWHQKLGQCDLLYRFYRSKFIFLMLVLVQRLLAVGPNWLAGRTLSPRPFLTYHPFDLEPFLKVTADVWNLTWSRFKCGTNGSQECNLSVSAWFMMVTNMSPNDQKSRSLWPGIRSQEVIMFSIGLHCIWQEHLCFWVAFFSHPMK